MLIAKPRKTNRLTLRPNYDVFFIYIYIIYIYIISAVLGANAMFGKKIVFDESLMRISFSASSCK